MASGNPQHFDSSQPHKQVIMLSNRISSHFARLACATGLMLTAATPAVLAQEKGKWVNISDGVIEQLAREGKKIGWPGQTAGVGVDRTTGEVYMVVCDQGLWKSSDRGKTFRRIDGGAIGGRCETGFALNFDPAGKRLACFMIYGGSAMTADAGKTWQPMKTSHWDFGAVDWESTGKCLLAFEHHSSGTLGLSTDGGETWKKTRYDFAAAVGLFDAQTLVRSDKKGILRSTDGGATWKKVSEMVPGGNVMYTLKGIGYLASSRGVLVSKDKGATWSVLGSPVDAALGPLFGREDARLVVVGEEGLHETTDAGKTWRLVAPSAPEIGLGNKGPNYRVGPNYAWDPQGEVFYASSMGKPTLKYAR
jgi:photosystem II stability/assembly factor-like uncharacterized protein